MQTYILPSIIILCIMFFVFPGSTDIIFTDITAQAGINNTFKSSCVALADYDGDGYLDIYVGNSGRSSDPVGKPNILYHNNGNGTFSDVANAARVSCQSQTKGASFGDFNNDGKPDLYVANDFALNVLYSNKGEIFDDITSSTGVEGCIDDNNGEKIPNGYGTALADIDNDGFLDIYVINLGSPNMLYRNNGNLTFTDIASQAGVEAGEGVQSAGTCALFSDYNNDGRMDLLALNGYGLPSFFYRNDAGVFKDITHKSGLGDFMDAEGGAFGDYDNDGDMDLLISNCASAEGAPLPNILYRNDDGIFTDVTQQAGLTDEDYSLGVSFSDLDNDGWLDIFVVNNGGTNRLYRNNTDGTFTDITEKAGLADEGLGSSAAIGDFNNDGYLDIYLANTGLPDDDTGDPDILYLNNGGANNWLQVQLLAKVSNLSAIGARIKVSAGNLKQIREISGGKGYAQDSPVSNFGLGEFTSADLVEVIWPSGIVQRIANVSSNQRIQIKENGSSSIDPQSKASLAWGGIKHSDRNVTDEAYMGQNYPNPFNPETWIPYQLSYDSPVVITIFDSNGQMIRQFDMGQQKAGNYLSKDKALYWDGTNWAGEKVSSRVYFYQIHSGNLNIMNYHSDVRKMLLIR